MVILSLNITILISPEKMNAKKEYLNFFIYFIFNTCLWVFFALLSFVQNYFWQTSSGRKFPWVEAVSYLVSEYFFLWAMGLLIYFIFQKTLYLSWQSFLKIHLPISLLYGFLFICMSLALTYLIRDYFGVLKESFWTTYSTGIQRMLLYSVNGALNYWLMLIILLGVSFYQKFRKQLIFSLELETRLTRSQLQALKMQLQPHFLFNALNTIAMLVRRNKNEEAVEMISGLSDLLRVTLNKDNEQWVSLKEELDLLQKYLAIEQVRFKDKLTVNLEIDPASLQIPVPNLLLQPIVENAFKYGISQKMQQALLKINTNVEGEYLEISVFNSGSVIPLNWNIEKNTGIGLNNTLARLQQLYGKRYQFEINNVEEPLEGVLVKMMFPAQNE